MGKVRVFKYLPIAPYHRDGDNRAERGIEQGSWQLQVIYPVAERRNGQQQTGNGHQCHP